MCFKWLTVTVRRAETKIRGIVSLCCGTFNFSPSCTSCLETWVCVSSLQFGMYNHDRGVGPYLHACNRRSHQGTRREYSREEGADKKGALFEAIELEDLLLTGSDILSQLFSITECSNSNSSVSRFPRMPHIIVQRLKSFLTSKILAGHFFSHCSETCGTFHTNFLSQVARINTLQEDFWNVLLSQSSGHSDIHWTQSSHILGRSL